MIFLSEQQVLKKYQSLPQELRDVLDSPLIATMIMKICLAHHLPKEKIESIFHLVGKAILGFIHKEDIVKEIQSETNLDKRIVVSVVQDVEKKIFASIKEDINKYYNLSPSFSSSVEEKLEKLAKVDKEASDLLNIIERNPLELLKDHIVDLRKLEEEKRKAETPQMISLEKEKSGAEAEKIKEEKPAIMAEKEELKPFVPEIKQEIKANDQPLILHKQEEMKPILGMKKSLGGLFGFLRSKEELREEVKAPKPVAVEIQIGGAEPSKSFGAVSWSDKQDKPPMPLVANRVEPIRVVHYTDLRTPLKDDKKPMTNDQQQIKPPISPRVEAIESVVSGEFIKIEHPPKYQPKLMTDQRPITNEQRQSIKVELPVKKEETTVDLRKTAEPKVEPKIEPKKESEEMIDLSTLQKM